MAKGFKTVSEYEEIKKERAGLLNDAVQQYNDCEDKVAADKLDKQIKDLQKEYNDASRCIVMLNCIESEGNTIAAACKTRVYPVIKVSAQRLDDGSKVYKIEPDIKLIDLSTFDRSIISAWFYRSELLCAMMTTDAMKNLGFAKERIADMMRFFKISEEAAAADKVSKTTLKKVVPEIIGKMIGEEYAEKVLPADINHMIYGFTSDDKRSALNTRTASTKQVCKLLADICHRILTDGFYTIDSKQIKIK